MDYLLPALAAVAARQHGLFSRAQALAAGYSEHDVRWATGRSGPWFVLRRGIYALRADVDALDEPARWGWRDRAAHLATEEPHILSHDSAAQLLQLPLVGVERGLSHVTRPGLAGTRTRYGIKHHLGRRQPRDVATVEGVRLTGLARTSLDLAREHGFATGVAAMDAARRRGAALRAFEIELGLMSRWPHVRRARAALAFSNPLAETPGESLARILVVELGVGPVVAQFPVPLAGRTAYVDLRVGRHLFEFDGRVKMRSVEDGGFAGRGAEAAWWDEKVRQTEICGLGFGMSRLVWADLWGPARARAKARLLAEYAVTERRFGRELPPDLEAFAVAHPRQVA